MGDTPSPPDPYATAKAQGDMNTQTAKTQQEMNMVDQNTPYGSLKYSQTGTNSDGTPHFQSDVNLNATGQGLLDQSNQNKMQTGQLASQLLGAKSGALSGQPLDLSYGATEAKLNELNKNTLDPMWQHNTDMQEQKLYNQGVRPGSDAYDASMRNFNTGKNNAYDQMFLGGHQQAVNDITQQYNSPLQTYSTLMTGSQPQNPSFQSTPTSGVAPVNYAGMVSDNYKNELTANSAQMGGLFGLGGTLGGGLAQGIGNAGGMAAFFSDRRLKKNIERIGTGARGLPVYTFEYIWSDDRHTGYMADEVERVAPEAIGEINGFKTVDYARV